MPLNIFGELERFTTEELYPHRYVITPVLVALGLAVLYAAYRLGAHLWVRNHLALSAVVGVPLLAAGLYVGDYLLSPLWEREFLEETSPLEAAGAPAAPLSTATQPAGAAPEPDGATAGDTPTPAPAVAQPSATPMTADGAGSTAGAQGGSQAAFQPRVVLTGTFVGADDFHFGRGDALIIETEPGQHVLRFENFSVRNGPDLFVYLSEDPTGQRVDEALNLGDLKATDGAFNYEIPPEVDVSRVRSAVVWCRQFSVLFTHAALQ